MGQSKASLTLRMYAECVRQEIIESLNRFIVTFTIIAQRNSSGNSSVDHEFRMYKAGQDLFEGYAVNYSVTSIGTAPCWLI